MKDKINQIVNKTLMECALLKDKNENILNEKLSYTIKLLFSLYFLGEEDINYEELFLKLFNKINITDKFNGILVDEYSDIIPDVNSLNVNSTYLLQASSRYDAEILYVIENSKGNIELITLLFSGDYSYDELIRELKHLDYEGHDITLFFKPLIELVTNEIIKYDWDSDLDAFRKEKILEASKNINGKALVY